MAEKKLTDEQQEQVDGGQVLADDLAEEASRQVASTEAMCTMKRPILQKTCAKAKCIKQPVC